MVSASLLIGDVYDALATMPDQSVDLVLSSPPFLALRAYLPPDHPLKHKEIGSERTPAEFIDTLLDVTEACDRVLAPHGSLVFELGDTYSGSGGTGGDYGEGGWRAGQERFARLKSRSYGTGAGKDREGEFLAQQTRLSASQRDSIVGYPMDKSLCMIPSLYAAGLVYGRNLLRPERETPRWRVRNLIVWHRPNPSVGALGDKWRPSCSYLTVACKSRTRWFDLDAVRSEQANPNTHPRTAKGVDKRANTTKTSPDGNRATLAIEYLGSAGAPPQDWIEYDDVFPDEGWTISTQGFPGQHYATWPEKLLVPFIESMCPTRVCRVCGEPSRRIVEKVRPVAADDSRRVKHANGERPHPGRQDRAPEVGWEIQTTTLGWTDCGHEDWRPGVVLDPFAGSGTTLQVATRLGRDAIGIDLDERNEDLVRQRVGMFFDGSVAV